MKDLIIDKKGWLLAGLLWMITIIYFSLTSSNNIPDIKLLSWDKLVHAVIYFVLVFLFTLGLAPKSLYQFSFLVFSISLGALMEFMQSWMHNGRHFDYADMLANTVGAIIAYIFCKTFLKI